MKITYNNNYNFLVELVYEDNSNNNAFFGGKLGEVFPIVNESKVLLSLGNKDKLNRESFKKAVYDLGRQLSTKDIKELSFNENNTNLDDKEFALSIVEAIKVSLYNFDHYKKEKVQITLETLNLPESFEKYNSEVEELLSVLDAQFLSRNLINLRSNDLYPETLANAAKEELSDLGINVKVYEEDAIKEMGLNAFWSVAKGSENKPRFIVMEYLNGGDKKPLVFVGKGITYDSGGYSLKPSNSMTTMNSDMGGGATVMAALKAIATNKLNVNVVGIVAACENALSGKSYKPGDIVKARNGMTIDVDNTDAEGRVTLADAVNYGVTEYKPKMIVDLATLTGAILITLGETYTGAVTNNEEAFAEVMEAAKEADEKIWQLPNDDFFRNYNKSDSGDIKNSGGRMAGSITAGQFIEAFVEDYPWVHLDIAGTAYLSAPQGLNQAGGTGVHVKTLYNLAKNNQ